MPNYRPGVRSTDVPLIRRSRRSVSGASESFLGRRPVRGLVELKLASGMTNPDRLKDLADVQELIRAGHLPLELREELDPMVRDRFAEIWNATKQGSDAEDEY